jgi:hypothetical protein
MPESIPASLVIDTLKDAFREARKELAAEVAEPPQHSHLGPILSVPDTYQKTVLAALDKAEQIRVLTCATEDKAATIAGGLYVGGAVETSCPKIPARAIWSKWPNRFSFVLHAGRERAEVTTQLMRMH